MPNCGSQVILCDVPINFDTYKGCTHACSYCFTQRKVSLQNAAPAEGAGSLRNFIEGRRNALTSWCDWNIPLHWGSMSDPFQPGERRMKRSLACLEVLAETGYPMIVSTKGTGLLTEEPWLSLLGKCNVVVQVSMVHPDFDEWEPGTPPFAERLKALPVLARNSKRLIVRVQPYVVGYVSRVNHYFGDYAEAGVHGLIFEGLKRFTSAAGMEKIGADFVFPIERLRADFRELREAAHEHGMKFYAGENRLRYMGDSATCCGVGDLPDWRVNKANMNYLPEIIYTDKMKEPGTALPFKSFAQDASSSHTLAKMSYEDAMTIAKGTRTNRLSMGLSIEEPAGGTKRGRQAKPRNPQGQAAEGQ